MKNLFYALMFILSFSTLSQAKEIPCDGKFKVDRVKNIKLTIMNNCDLHIGFEGNGLAGRYRSYTIGANGFFMAFISTNDDELLSKATGSRIFHLFPVLKNDHIKVTEIEDGITVVGKSGITATFKSSTEELEKIEGHEVKLKELEHISITAKMKGGIEVLPVDCDYMFDYGWKLGEMSFSQLTKISEIILSSGQVCNFKNKEIYTKKKGEDVKLKFKNQKDFDRFVASKCN